MRAVAERAGVDVALVPYYFDNKDGLFAASLELPLDPHEVIEQLFGEGLEGIGERVVRTFATYLDDPTIGPALLGLIRSALSESTGHAVMRDFIDNVLIEAYARHLGRPDARQRAALAGSQIIGLALARRVLAVEPLASMSVDDVVAYAAPTIQRYLTGDISPR